MRTILLVHLVWGIHFSATGLTLLSLAGDSRLPARPGLSEEYQPGQQPPDSSRRRPSQEPYVPGNYFIRQQLHQICGGRRTSSESTSFISACNMQSV
ncbi:hypothetical protein AVEN_169347-1 [Araneus ventricosus]|uniref:Uncharacterized protein n=1 Tax=Araneus ventricosus TaxID=182803 RepID=A0A4Y2ULL6_ARAVE|nr:hypothetical protein AVEN_169347-1 [Araneus ventricosus]